MQREIETLRQQYLSESVDRSELVQKRKYMEAEVEKMKSLVKEQFERMTKLEAESNKAHELHREESTRRIKIEKQLSQRDEYVRNLCGALRKAEEERDSLQAEMAKSRGMTPQKQKKSLQNGTNGAATSYTEKLEAQLRDMQQKLHRYEEEKRELAMELSHVTTEGVSPEKVAPRLKDTIRKRDEYIKNLCLALRKAEEERDALKGEYRR